MSVLAAAVMDVLRTLGVLLGGATVGLAGALLVGWEIGWIRGHRVGAAPTTISAAAPVLQASTPATEPGPTIPAPVPVVAREVSAGDGGDPDAGRHRELYEREYARQLARLDARRMQIATGMQDAARTNGDRMPSVAPPWPPDPVDG